MRTDQYRYTEWIQLASGKIKASEMYDHQNDPLENSNVVDKEKYTEILNILTTKLHKKFDGVICGIKSQSQ